MAPGNDLAPHQPVARPVDESDAQRRIANRLKRARGQLGAVIAALEAGADGSSALTQLSAVSGAVNRARYAVISSAMRECLATADADGKATGGPTIHELEKLFLKST